VAGATPDPPAARELSAAEIGALAHLYRGEVYRSTIWRTRLDMTTNWSVVTLGVALSITFSSAAASPLPLVLVGILIAFFLVLEARRYRYFNVWRARARWLEVHFYAPMLRHGDLQLEAGWQETLAQDYVAPEYHISFMRALGRRLRNYVWILAIQTLAYYGKITVHPAEPSSFAEFVERAEVGPIPGEWMIVAGVLYNFTWVGLAIWTWSLDARRFRGTRSTSSMG
jgi:uncharacterized membrane protein